MEEENIRLRNENLFLQLMSHDVFEKVMENLHLNEDHTSELWKQFNYKFDFDGFCQAYHEYVQERKVKVGQEHLQNVDFDAFYWGLFWEDYDECVYDSVKNYHSGSMWTPPSASRYAADVDWEAVFAEQSGRCRRCHCKREGGCDCSEESDEDNEAGAGGE